MRLTLIGKPGCHLCDEARETVQAVAERLRDAERAGGPIDIELTELDILDDEALAREHAEYIPVLQVDGRRHAIWRVDPDRLVTAVEKAASRGGLLSRLRRP